MNKPKFPEVKPKLPIQLNAELIADFSKYSTGGMHMTMDASDVSLNNKKVGTVAYALGGGVSVTIGERLYLVHFKDIFSAVYNADQSQNVEHIKTKPVLHPELIRRYGFESQHCAECGTVYESNKIPTVEEGCKGCK